MLRIASKLQRQEKCRTEVRRFLTKYGQSGAQIKVDQAMDSLIVEIQKQNPVGIFFHRTFVPVLKNPTVQKKCIVIDLGGTNLRYGIGYFRKRGQFRLEAVKKTNFQEFIRHSGKDATTFYAGIADLIGDLPSDVVGFCFSHNIESTPDLDAKLLSWSKESFVPGTVGTLIGKETLRALNDRQSPKRSVSVLNDATAALLGGIVKTKKESVSALSLIFGTGVNIAYTIPNGMILNSECGEFSGFEPGLFDMQVLSESDDPKHGMTEKMISGKYLPQLMVKAVCKAVEDGLIQAPVQNTPTLPEINLFLKRRTKNPFTMTRSPTRDQDFTRETCLEIIDRSALITAILVDSFACVNSSRKRTIDLVTEGTSFFSLHTFQSRFKKHLHECSAGKRKYHFIKGKNINLIGTAALALDFTKKNP